VGGDGEFFFKKAESLEKKVAFHWGGGGAWVKNKKRVRQGCTLHASATIGKRVGVMWRRRLRPKVVENFQNCEAENLEVMWEHKKDQRINKQRIIDRRLLKMAVRCVKSEGHVMGTARPAPKELRQGVRTLLELDEGPSTRGIKRNKPTSESWQGKKKNLADERAN